MDTLLSAAFLLETQMVKMAERVARAIVTHASEAKALLHVLDMAARAVQRQCNARWQQGEKAADDAAHVYAVSQKQMVALLGAGVPVAVPVNEFQSEVVVAVCGCTDVARFGHIVCDISLAHTRVYVPSVLALPPHWSVVDVDLRDSANAPIQVCESMAVHAIDGDGIRVPIAEVAMTRMNYGQMYDDELFRVSFRGCVDCDVTVSMQVSVYGIVLHEWPAIEPATFTFSEEANDDYEYYISRYTQIALLFPDDHTCISAPRVGRPNWFVFSDHMRDEYNFGVHNFDPVFNGHQMTMSASFTFPAERGAKVQVLITDFDSILVLSARSLRLFSWRATLLHTWDKSGHGLLYAIATLGNCVAMLDISPEHVTVHVSSLHPPWTPLQKYLFPRHAIGETAGAISLFDFTKHDELVLAFSDAPQCAWHLCNDFTEWKRVVFPPHIANVTGIAVANNEEVVFLMDGVHRCNALSVCSLLGNEVFHCVSRTRLGRLTAPRVTDSGFLSSFLETRTRNVVMLVLRGCGNES